MQNSAVLCRNERLCESQRQGPSPVWKQGAATLCTRCSVLGLASLRFTVGDACAVCNQTEQSGVCFPANGCGHWICVHCARRCIMWRDCDADVNPTVYGAPPCPMGCVNDAVGEQCGCPEWEEAIDLWSHDQPEQAAMFAEAQFESYQRHTLPPNGPRACPVCARRMRGE